jgi:type I restriction enzyme, S subunit
MGEWPTVPIGSVAEIYDGPHATPKTVSSGPIFLGIGALQNGRINLGETRHVTIEDFKVWTRRVKPQQGDFVFSYETRIGEAALIPDGLECCLGRRMGLVRVDRAWLDPRFLLYLYLSPDFQDFLRSRTVTGATVDRLALIEFPDFRIPLPPIGEQRAISSVLGALDDKIDLNRRMNETLEAMARAFFKDWFVDFGPTRAKMEGRAPYLAPEIWSLFPDRLDNEGKPQGWEWGTLADCASLNPESWSRSTYPALIEYVDLSGTKWGTIETTETHEQENAPSRAQRVLRPDDTIIGTVRPGNGSYAFVSKGGLTGSTGFAVLRPKQPEFREFVYFAATAPENIERLSHLADGAAYPAVRPEIVLGTEVVGPPEILTKAFSGITAPLIDRMETDKQESSTLAAARDLLLPKLMSGEIRVRDVEKIDEAAK